MLLLNACSHHLAVGESGAPYARRYASKGLFAPYDDAAMHSTFADTLSHEAAVQSRLSAAPDYLEGVAAFIAKRPAVFGDR